MRFVQINRLKLPTILPYLKIKQITSNQAHCFTFNQKDVGVSIFTKTDILADDNYKHTTIRTFKPRSIQINSCCDYKTT